MQGAVLVPFCPHNPKGDPCTSSLGLTWELVINAESQAPPKPTEFESVCQQDPKIPVIHVHVKDGEAPLYVRCLIVS